MVDVSARARRRAVQARTPFAAVLDDVLDHADQRSVGSWFDCPEPRVHGRDALSGPLPWVDPFAEPATGPLSVVDPLVPDRPAPTTSVWIEPAPYDEPTQYEPTQYEPTQYEPTRYQPTGSVWTEPVARELSAPEPGAHELPDAENADPERAAAEPAFEPAAFEPAAFEPAAFEPAAFEPAAGGPEAPERGMTPAVWTEPVRPEPSRGEPTPARRRRSRRAAAGDPLIRAAVLGTLLALLAGGATALAMDKTVTVTVDGQDRVLHTYAADVAGALDTAGLHPVPQDRVEPALPTDLADGDHIIVQRARRLTLVEGGGERAVWTTAGSVQEALAGLGVDASPVQMSAAPTAAIPLTGMSLELRVPRAVTLTDGTGKPQRFTSTASTVAGVLAERGVELGPEDVSVPPGDTTIADGSTVQVVRNGVGEVVESRPVAPPEQIIQDPKLPRGQKVVVEKGKPGERTAIMRVQVRNGQEIRREQVRAGGSTPPQPRVVRIGTSDELAADEDAAGYGATDEVGKAAPGKEPKVANGAVWDKLAKCEATGNWSINSGNGYYGGLQFDAGTWKAYGGTEYASLPHQASRAEQIAVASKVRDDRGGYGAWPACSSKLGLPQ